MYEKNCHLVGFLEFFFASKLVTAVKFCLLIYFSVFECHVTIIAPVHRSKVVTGSKITVSLFLTLIVIIASILLEETKCSKSTR